MRVARSAFLMAPWDANVRRAAKNRLSDILRHPLRLFSPVRFQSVGIIQAPDIQPSGVADMCDSCPDMTVWNGTLINSCRMDEYRLYGGMLSVTERQKTRAKVESSIARDKR